MSSGSGGANDRATQQPPFDPDVFARESESHIETAPVSKRPTVPPIPSYTNLRDSCRQFPASEPATSETAERTKTPTLSAVVDLLASTDDLEWFNLDGPARAIVTVIDGALIVEEILGHRPTPWSDAPSLRRRRFARRFRERPSRGWSRRPEGPGSRRRAATR